MARKVESLSFCPSYEVTGDCTIKRLFERTLGEPNQHGVRNVVIPITPRVIDNHTLRTFIQKDLLGNPGFLGKGSRPESIRCPLHKLASSSKFDPNTLMERAQNCGGQSTSLLIENELKVKV